VLELEMLVVIFRSFDLHVIPSYRSYDPIWQAPSIMLSMKIEEHSMKPNNVSNSEFEDPFCREIEKKFKKCEQKQKAGNHDLLDKFIRRGLIFER
jgi:hypothetical protein